MTLANHSIKSLSQPHFVPRNDTYVDQRARWAVKEINSVEWDQLLTGFDDTCFEQTAEFATERWGEHRTVCVKIERNGDVVGGACVAIFGLPGLGRGLAYVKHGPVWRQNGQTTDYENYRSVIAQLIQKFGREQGHALVIVPRPHPGMQAREYDVLYEMGFESGRDTRDPNRYFVDISLSLEDQFKSLDQKWRYNLKRARSNDLDIDWSGDDSAISKFTELYNEMNARKGFNSTDPMDSLKEMALNLPHALKPQIVFASHAGRPIAGAVVMTCGDVAYYVFGGSRKEALPLRAGYAVQWAIIEKLKQQGVTWYDLGGEAGANGLRQFKKGLSGKRGIVLETRGELKFCCGPGSKLACKLVLGASEISRALRATRTAVRITK